MTSVAAASPHAWFPVARPADEIVTATPDNRMVAYPYTKLMTSIMDVDMAAAVLLASVGQGRRAGRARGAARLPARLGLRRGPDARGRPPRPLALPRHGRRGRRRAGGRRHRRRRRRAPRPVLVLRLARCASRSTRSGSAEYDPRAAARDRDRRPALPRRTRVELHDPLAGGDDRERSARDPGLARRGERRRHAHAEARLRGVVDRPGGRRGGRPGAVRAAAAAGADRGVARRARPRSPPTRCCTGATASPSGRC